MPNRLSRSLLRWAVAAAFVASAALGCGDIKKEPDATVSADATASADATVSADAQPPATAPSSVAQSAGGGAATSDNYQLQVRFGAPQPMGQTSSATYRASLGRTSR